MSDFSLSSLSFETTSVDVVAISPAGHDWLATKCGAGCVSVTVPKSASGDVIEAIEAAGLEWTENGA